MCISSSLSYTCAHHRASVNEGICLVIIQMMCATPTFYEIFVAKIISICIWQFPWEAVEPCCVCGRQIMEEVSIFTLKLVKLTMTMKGFLLLSSFNHWTLYSICIECNFKIVDIFKCLVRHRLSSRNIWVKIMSLIINLLKSSAASVLLLQSSCPSFSLPLPSSSPPPPPPLFSAVQRFNILNICSPSVMMCFELGCHYCFLLWPINTMKTCMRCCFCITCFKHNILRVSRMLLVLPSKQVVNIYFALSLLAHWDPWIQLRHH